MNVCGRLAFECWLCSSVYNPREFLSKRSQQTRYGADLLIPSETRFKHICTSVFWANTNRIRANFAFKRTSTEVSEICVGVSADQSAAHTTLETLKHGNVNITQSELINVHWRAIHKWALRVGLKRQNATPISQLQITNLFRFICDFCVYVAETYIGAGPRVNGTGFSDSTQDCFSKTENMNCCYSFDLRRNRISLKYKANLRI